MKKSQSRGITVEDLKLPAITDFATGESREKERERERERERESREMKRGRGERERDCLFYLTLQRPVGRVSGMGWCPATLATPPLRPGTSRRAARADTPSHPAMLTRGHAHSYVHTHHWSIWGLVCLFVCLFVVCGVEWVWPFCCAGHEHWTRGSL